MAIIKGTFGTNLRKRVGQVVYRNRGGVNIASARPASVKNPRTSAQMKQRMIFTTVQSAYKTMREIVDHSQEGTSYGAMTMASFMKLNLLALRLDYTYGKFNLKGNSNVVAPYPFKIATGSLVFDQKIRSIDENAVVTGFNIGTATIATMTYAQLLAILGVKKGDQLTFIIVAGHSDKVIGNNGYQQFSENYFRPIRVVFSLTADDSDLAFTANGVLSDAICDQANSDFFYHDLKFALTDNGKNILFTNSAFGNYTAGAGWFCYGAAIILSRKVGSSWARSNTDLFMTDIPNQTWGSTDVLESYNPASNYYLNNATV